MHHLFFCLATLCLVLGARIKRQGTEVEIVCTSCDMRELEQPPQVCCRCQDMEAPCNNDLGSPPDISTLRPDTTTDILDSIFDRTETTTDPLDAIFDTKILKPGLTCANSLECQLFSDCSKNDGACTVAGFTLLDTVDLRQAERRNGASCPSGQQLCCNPVPGDILQTRLGLAISGNNPLGDDLTLLPDGVENICRHPDLMATVNFNHGLVCGKRDSRVYYNAVLSETEGGEGDAANPGEWPWAVLIFRSDNGVGEGYVGAGTMMDNDVIVTTATKVQEFLGDPSVLRIRLGDWDPLDPGPNSREDFPHVTKKAACIKLHPQFNPRSLAYNVAVIKLEDTLVGPQTPEVLSVVQVVDIRSGPRRPADRPGGVEGFSRIPEREAGILLRQGGSRVEDQVEQRKRLLADLTNEVNIDSIKPDTVIPRSYINTACLPLSQRQFLAGTQCWVAAWSNNLREQREVEIPLVGREKCEEQLRPEFVSRGVTRWPGLSPSELCAGGIPGKDSCQGEGGAPLVCLDQERDQYYAVGLVNYGFQCGGNIPAVYVNLADPQVKAFITESFGANIC